MFLNEPMRLNAKAKLSIESPTCAATLMLATAAVLGALQVPEAVRWMIVLPMVVSAYAFCVATLLAALTGDRGLQRSHGWGQVVYASNMLGAAGSVLSAAVFLGAAAVSL